MAQLLNRVRTVVRSLGNQGALRNVEAELAATAQARAAVDHLVARLAEQETLRTPQAA
jgi:hypothetical protein